MKIEVISCHSENHSTLEVNGQVLWDAQVTPFALYCEGMAGQDHDVKLAIKLLESKLVRMLELLSLAELRSWCLSQICEKMPWFLTERIDEPDSGSEPITSKPEEMIQLLLPGLRIKCDLKTKKILINGWLACPPLIPENILNHDVNRWLGNHDYRFTLNEQYELSDFRIDG